MRRAEPNGFTLIELMVALGVFAIAALALLRLEGASVASTADLDRRLLREVVAGNLAAETLSDPDPPALGSSSGSLRNMGRSFAWRRDVAARSDLGVLAVTVTVSETTAGADGRAFTLDFTRLPGR